MVTKGKDKAGNDEFNKESSQHTARFRAGTILPAKTGNDNNNKIAVTKIAQTNKGNFSHFY